MPARLQPRAREFLDGREWRIVRDEMPRELRAHVPRGPRVHREIPQDALALLQSIVGITLPEQLLRAGLMEHLAEQEFTGRAVIEAEAREAAVHVLAADRPAGDRLRERRDIGLRVSAIHAERVQFEDFTREVLVDIQLAITTTTARRELRCARVRTDRRVVVEVQQHRGMLFDGQQQVDELSRDVRANRLALHGARQAKHRDLVDRYREVIGPELGEAFEEGSVGVYGVRDARDSLVDVHRPVDGWQLERGRDLVAVLVVGFLPGAAFFHHLLASFDDACQRFGRRLETGALELRRRSFQLARKPVLGITCDQIQIPGPGAQAESVRRDRRHQVFLRRSHGLTVLTRNGVRR
jgi:hypothetical protein